jgi:hypothetical protein
VFEDTTVTAAGEEVIHPHSGWNTGITTVAMGAVQVVTAATKSQQAQFAIKLR